jgi:membrane protein DedA with SNARE-associated domain
MSALPIVETVVSVIQTVMMEGGLLALIALMAVESFGIPPLPSEVILPFAGFLVATGAYSLPAAVLAALLGGVLGSYAAYAVGRWGRPWLTTARLGPLRLDPKHLDSMDRWFVRRGESTVLIARLLPVVRSYISYPAGTARMEPVRFGLFTVTGATPFTLALVYAGFLLRQHWTAIVPILQDADYVAVGALVFLLGYLVLRWKGVVTHGFPPRLRRAGPDSPGPPPAP